MAKKKRAADKSDWRSIEDDREKYQAYLCSREWAKLKTAVHERGGGLCERCELFEINAVHHLTYARKYAEELEDLAGWCKNCHNFTHDKDWFDPIAYKPLIHYARCCNNEGRGVAPFEVIDCQYSLQPDIVAVLALIDHGRRLLDVNDIPTDDILESSIIAMDSVLPFKYYGFPFVLFRRCGPEKFYEITDGFGLSSDVPDGWVRDPGDGE